MSVGGALDTNVLVRLLVHDDESQTLVVSRLLEQHIRRSESLWVAVTVMLELEWVLRARYKFSKADVIRAFSALLATIELIFESEDALDRRWPAMRTEGRILASTCTCRSLKKGTRCPFGLLTRRLPGQWVQSC